MTFLPIAAAVLAMAQVTTAQAPARLAEVLKGRSEGRTLSCVSTRRLGQSFIVAGEAIVYRSSGGRWYVNRPERPELLEEGRILITRTPLTQLCRGEPVYMVDRYSRIEVAPVTLGSFVEYQRTR